MRGKAHTDDIRAQVIAALLAGENVSDVSRRMQLDKSVVSRIKNTIAPEKLQQVATETAGQMDSLICGYLEKNFAALSAICELASDVTYLRRYAPNQIAELHEKLAGKAFQLIEAEPVTAE